MTIKNPSFDDPVLTEGSTSKDSTKQVFGQPLLLPKTGQTDNDDPENLSKKPNVDWSYVTNKGISLLNVIPYRQN